MNKQQHRLRSYLRYMATRKKMEKKPLKSMAELTKNFEEFEKNNELKENTTAEDFERAIKKALESKPVKR